jgi:hypothetical protein
VSEKVDSPPAFADTGQEPGDALATAPPDTE